MDDIEALRKVALDVLSGCRTKIDMLIEAEPKISLIFQVMREDIVYIETRLRDSSTLDEYTFEEIDTLLVQMDAALVEHCSALRN